MLEIYQSEVFLSYLKTFSCTTKDMLICGKSRLALKSSNVPFKATSAIPSASL